MSAALASDTDGDACLAAALACDVDRAFERFVIAYRTRIVAFVARMLADDALAEDVAQEAFVRAYRALRTYPSERIAALRLRSWLFAIAHNLTRNAVRDAPPPSDELVFEDGEPRAALADLESGPEPRMLSRETWRELTRAIDTLTPALRPAFVLRYIGECSYDEIAQILDRPVGTVRAAAHRARLAVRQTMETSQ